MQLNPDQQAVVDHDGHCLVVACPGSGKTRVIVVKIGHILRTIPKSSLCAVTFTRDSAQELKNRLHKELPADTVNRRTRVGTFHSLAIRQLRAYEQLKKVASPAEQLVFVRRAIAAIDEEITFEDAVATIENIKSKLGNSPEEDSPLYQAYTSLLKRSNVEDLYDVLRKSLTLMRDGEIKPYPVSHMLVDEFQDTDEIQLGWVLEHVKAGTKVTVVGDDDQSVYSFRHALGYAGMEEFKAQSGARLIRLGTNYRCKKEILSAAETLISHNNERIDKSLVADRGPGGKIFSRLYPRREFEAEAAVEAIWPDVVPCDEPGVSFTVPAGRWAVLARNRRVLDGIETALQARRIKYLRPPSESIWNRPPYVYFLSLLRAIQTGAADGIDQALHFTGITSEGMELLHGATGSQLYTLLDRTVPSINGMAAEDKKRLDNFAGLASGWRDLTRRGLYNQVIAGMTDWFYDRIKGDDERELFIDVVKRVEKLGGSLAQRANTLSSSLPAKANKDDQELPSGVALMTMHGSKGLEFDKVWIIAAETDVIPSPKNPVYEEERRLMYVAMTRARDELFLSSRISANPSPFVVEAGCAPSTSV